MSVLVLEKPQDKEEEEEVTGRVDAAKKNSEDAAAVAVLELDNFFLHKSRAKNYTEGFYLLLVIFGKSLPNTAGETERERQIWATFLKHTTYLVTSFQRQHVNNPQDHKTLKTVLGSCEWKNKVLKHDVFTF